MAQAAAANPGIESDELIANEVQIEEIGPARKRLTITIPADAVNEKIEESIGTLAVEAALPGFRKGHAPRKLLEKRFGGTLRTETKNQIIAQAYSSAIEKHKISPVGSPELSEQAKTVALEQGKPLTFSVEIDVAPEFDLPELDGIEVKKPTLEITDDHVSEELERQYYRWGRPARVEGELQSLDRLLCEIKVTREGESEPFFTNQALVVLPREDDGGRGQVLGLMIDGLRERLIDLKVGDTYELETVGPDAHEREDIRGVKLQMHGTIIAAERVTPATTQELIDRFGLGSEDNLRDQIRMALSQRRDQEQLSAMREQVQEHLLKAVDFELPEKLSSAQLARNLERIRMELLARGVMPEDVETRLAELRSESEEATRRRLKLMFILHRLAEKFSIEVSDAEVNGVIAAMASQRGERPAKLRAELVQANRMGDLVLQIRESRAVDRVLATAKTVDVSAEDWNAMVSDRAGAKRKAAATTRSRPAAPKAKAAKPEPKTTRKSAPATTKKKTSRKTR
jgi:trigger factor